MGPLTKLVDLPRSGQLTQGSVPRRANCRSLVHTLCHLCLLNDLVDVCVFSHLQCGLWVTANRQKLGL